MKNLIVNRTELYTKSGGSSSCKTIPREFQFASGESVFLGIYKGREIFLKDFFPRESSEPLRTIYDLFDYVAERENHHRNFSNHYAPKEYSQVMKICRNAREALLDIIESQFLSQ